MSRRGYDAATVTERDADSPPRATIRGAEWILGGLGGLLCLFLGIDLVPRARRLPLAVPMDVALTVIALLVAVLPWRGSPRRAAVRVLGVAAMSSIVFAATSLWFARGVTQMGEGYGEYLFAFVLYLGAAVGLVVAWAVGTAVADTVTSEGTATGSRRAARAMLSLSVLLSCLGTHAAIRRPPYERWLSSVPVRADFGVPAAWPSIAWSIVDDHEEAPRLYRDLHVDGQRLRVFRHGSAGGSSWTQVCWRSSSLGEGRPERPSGAHECTRPTRSRTARLLVRHDDDRGLWFVDYDVRHYGAAFTDLGVRVDPSYASILSSAAPPVSWVVASWAAALCAIALLRARTGVGPGAPPAAPYRTQPAAAQPDDAARLREAFAFTVCALHSAPLAAYFVRAALG